MPNPSMLTFRTVMLSVVLAGCGIYRSGTDPDAMSEAEHREMAESYRRRELSHRGRVDPDAVQVAETSHGGYSGLLGGGDPASTHASPAGQVFNPTASHLSDARRMHELASEHEAAADALVAYEAAECSGVDHAHRASCPLVGPVRSVTDVPGGVRLNLSDDADVDALANHAHCHAAFARRMGSHGMDHCPLYVPQITVVREGHTLTLTTDGDVDELRRRAAAHVTAGPSESAD